MTAKKHPTITFDELMRRVSEEQQRLERAKRGEGPGVDPVREERMQKFREKYPEGLRAIVHPSRNSRKYPPII